MDAGQPNPLNVLIYFNFDSYPAHTVMYSFYIL